MYLFQFAIYIVLLKTTQNCAGLSDYKHNFIVYLIEETLCAVESIIVCSLIIIFNYM